VPVIERRAARALLIAEQSVLLIEGLDPSRPELGTWWHTPGGGIEPDESLAAAVAREVFEETGLAIEPERFGAVVAARTTEFEFEGVTYHQREWFFAVEVAPFTPRRAEWNAAEQRSLLGYRWWTAEALEQTGDRVYPREIAALLRAALRGPIDPPMELSGD
jgi:8-oxo-dGTP pyrophosphatase MutT (NUDIX family)